MTHKIRLFVGKFASREVTYDLTEEGVRRSIENSYLFGESSSDEPYVLGNHWAQSPEDAGWRIEVRESDVPEVIGEIAGQPGETQHVIWTCPRCNRSWSEDYVSHDDIVILLVCSTCSQFALVRLPPPNERGGVKSVHTA